jgi:glyoxylase-like metal-dependent hydrolase (beta-lactamase superfamily II)
MQHDLGLTLTVPKPGLTSCQSNFTASFWAENCKAYWDAGSCDFLKPSQKRSDVIDMQLKKLGMSTDDIKVVVTSHTHLDHAGNIGMFPKAIHVLQKKELYQINHSQYQFYPI